MRIEMKDKRFRLDHADAFDARRGYTRARSDFSVFCGDHEAKAFFWRDREEKLFVRVSFKAGDTYHFRAKRANGQEIPDHALDAFVDYLSDFIYEWILEGTDDWPEFC